MLRVTTLGRCRHGSGLRWPLVAAWKRRPSWLTACLTASLTASPTASPTAGLRPRPARITTPAVRGTVLSLLLLAALPAPAPVRADPATREQTLSCLATYCDSLLARQDSVGRYESLNAAWWRAGIATRALLGGYELLEDARYLEGALRTVRQFLREQRYDGSWFAESYETTVPERRYSRNIADLASMTACLPLVAPHLPAGERSAALTAHETYLRLHVPRHDLTGGAFCNGLFEGTFYDWPYSVGTANQAHALVCHYHATGEKACLHRAEDAARFLVGTVRPDGRFTFHPHDTRRTSVLAPTAFHNGYYLLDGLLWVYRATEREELRQALRIALLEHLWGEEGLIERLRDPGWMLAAEGPGRAKAFGMVGLLSALGEVLGPVAGTGPLVEAGRARLCERITEPADWTVAELAFGALALAQSLSEESYLRF